MNRFRLFAMSALALLFLVEPLVGDDAAVPSNGATAEQLTERLRPSVVVITSAGRDGQREGLGSGFVVSTDGLIATNFHVVGEGRAVRVQLADGRQFEATAIHASERAADIAILKIDARELPALELGNSDELKQGQSVLALGNPQGLKHSVVSGVVSGMREVDGRPMIQLAIPIEPGNSGGPLVDLQGRVQGMLTMKSLVTPNLGFALTVNLLKPLLDKPNPIPMSRWLTIGALDPREWQPLFGARWRQRAGRISVEEPGSGFGGRSVCLWRQPTPDEPFEMTVTLKLDDEAGAAGLAFGADGRDRHFGFYPTGGHLRLTRFDGPDVFSWHILYDQRCQAYVAGGWNTLRVRFENDKIACYANDQRVVEFTDSAAAHGQVGLAKFRETKAQFKDFRVGRKVPRATVPADDVERILRIVGGASPKGRPEPELVDSLAVDSAMAAKVLRERATMLDQQAARLRELAVAGHQSRVIADLVRTLDAPEEKIDLFRAGLLVAKLDNEEVDVDAYLDELNRMAAELKATLPADASASVRIDALRKYLFDENGFHGSRGDYYNRANSYLNEVLDDREGLPITLSIVYIELARRLGLTVVGVGLPGHFVARHLPAEGEGQLIDVFDGAKPLSREEAAQHVRDANDRELTDADLAPMAKRAIIGRMLNNLLGVSARDPAAMHRYLNALVAIDPPNAAQFRWMRAIVRYRLELSDSAREDVEWLMEHKPAGIDLDGVGELQQAIERASRDP